MYKYYSPTETESAQENLAKVTCNQVEMRKENMTSNKPHSLIVSSSFLAVKLRVHKPLVLV
jgi:hypothetical protein